MCCQDGNEAIWQMVHEPARWPTRTEGSFSLHEQASTSELPTAAAELTIKLVTIQDGEPTAIQDWDASREIVPDGQSLDWQTAHEPASWPARAEGGFSLRPGMAELPTAAAELTIKLVTRTGKQ